MIKIFIYLTFLVMLGSCSRLPPSSQLNEAPTQQEVNSSELYYDLVNLALTYLDEEKGYFSSNSSKEVYLYPQAIVQTWNCYAYQQKNFFYHYSHIDTVSQPVFNTGIGVDYLKRVCEALHNPISLSRDSSKYQYIVKWAEEPVEEYIERSIGKAPLVLSPVIVASNGRYVVNIVRPDFEGGNVNSFSFRWSGMGFDLANSSFSFAQDFCWNGEDYVRGLCQG